MPLWNGVAVRCSECDDAGEGKLTDEAMLELGAAFANSVRVAAPWHRKGGIRKRSGVLGRRRCS